MVGAADQELPLDRADVAGVVAVVAVVAEEEVVNVGGARAVVPAENCYVPTIPTRSPNIK